MTVRDTYHKGQRAERQARAQWEALYWETTPARCSRGAWDFEAFYPKEGAYGPGTLPRMPSEKVHVQVKCGTKGDSKAKFRRELQAGRLSLEAVCVIMVRHDGGRWHPPSWDYILLDNAALLAEAPRRRNYSRRNPPA